MKRESLHMQELPAIQLEIQHLPMHKCQLRHHVQVQACIRLPYILLFDRTVGQTSLFHLLCCQPELH